MVAFARSEFKLDEVPKNSTATTRHHLESVWRQTGRMPKDLAEAPELPELTVHVWDVYRRIAAYREWDGMSGPKLLTPRAVKDWCWMTGALLSTWEKQVILRLDAEWMAQRPK